MTEEPMTEARLREIEMQAATAPNRYNSLHDTQREADRLRAHVLTLSAEVRRLQSVIQAAHDTLTDYRRGTVDVYAVADRRIQAAQMENSARIEALEREVQQARAEALRDAADVVRTYENDMNVHGQEDYARALERMAEEAER